MSSRIVLLLLFALQAVTANELDLLHPSSHEACACSQHEGLIKKESATADNFPSDLPPAGSIGVVDVGPNGVTIAGPFPQDNFQPSQSGINGPLPQEQIPVKPVEHTDSAVTETITPAIPNKPHPGDCIKHILVPVPVKYVQECVKHIPVVKNTIRHQEETITRRVPVTEQSISTQHERIVTHIPLVKKYYHNVVEIRTRQVPIIKSRTRTIVEPYTEHVRVTEKHSRPVEDSITRTFPVTETRIRPIILKRTRMVPLTEKRVVPVVDTKVEHVPIKQKFCRNIVEHIARPQVTPCHQCDFGPKYPPGFSPLSIVPTGDLPIIPSLPTSDSIPEAEHSADTESPVITPSIPEDVSETHECPCTK